VRPPRSNGWPTWNWQRAIERRYKCSRLQAQSSIGAFQFSGHKTRQQAKPRILRLLDLEFLTKSC
jgi:hypothetical protein